MQGILQSGVIVLSDRIYSIDEIKRIAAPIAAGFGVERVCLFGSYAKGEATSASDIDLIIDKGSH